MKNESLNDATPAKAILITRIIWAALIMGPIFLTVLTIIISQPRNNNDAATLDPATLQIMVIINAAMLFVIPTFGFLIRQRIFTRSRTADGILPAATYATGNIIFWASCEGVSFFGLVVALLNRNVWPHILLVAAALALQALTFPRLSAIEPPNQTFKIE